MKIVVDKAIPYIKEAIEKIADEVVYCLGNAFTPEVVRDADALIVRTRTHCDRKLLEGSRVRFIATATIGYDHIDAEYCREAGIVWTNAPGCNADSVAQYIQSTLLVLKLRLEKDLSQMTMGVVGVGNVGRRVVAVAAGLGMRVLLNDLPREEQEGSESFTSLDMLAKECDVISFHVPLYIGGKYKTYHLADDTFFRSLVRRPVIINTSRGEVVDTEALLTALREETISAAVIDVWENEPAINQDLLFEVLIGTPHIAGYSADGKANATRMSLDALCRFFDRKVDYTIAPPPSAEPVIYAPNKDVALLRIYNPEEDSERLKAQPLLFESFRNNYPLRREEVAYKICVSGKYDKEIKGYKKE